MALATAWADTPAQERLVIDGFAGPGGWTEGLRMLGLRDVGLEWDEAACKTRAAAGHTTIRCDVSSFILTPLVGKVWGLIQSPPCTKFSTAGNGLGRQFIDVLADGIRRMMRGEDCRQELHERIYPVALTARQETNHARPAEKQWPASKVEAAAMEDTVATVLVLEPARFLYALIVQRGGRGRPLEWAAFEQVPSVLPLWEVYGEELRRLGWSVWTGRLNAANYGIPQTRERAVLIASMVRKVAPPEPTHAKVSEPDLFGPGLPQWVSMATALGLDGTETVNTRGDRKTPGGNEFPAAGPSWALTEKARSWTLRSGPGRAGGQWIYSRPATTVCATNRVSPPGHRDRSTNGESQFSNPDTVYITVPEAATLQSFAADYPWHGTRTKQFEQVGNAVPPLLAAHMVAAATGLPLAVDAALAA